MCFQGTNSSRVITFQSHSVSSQSFHVRYPLLYFCVLYWFAPINVFIRQREKIELHYLCLILSVIFFFQNYYKYLNNCCDQQSFSWNDQRNVSSGVTKDWLWTRTTKFFWSSENLAKNCRKQRREMSGRKRPKKRNRRRRKRWQLSIDMESISRLGGVHKWRHGLKGEGVKDLWRQF